MIADTWVSYVQDYCFVSNTYMVNASKTIVKGEATNIYKEEIVYYQVNFFTTNH